MPGGICAKEVVALNQSAVRCAEVIVKVRGVTRKVNLGGVAKAVFTGMPEEQFDSLEKGMEFGVEWQDVYFYGEDPILGALEVSLRNPPAAGNTTCTVESTDGDRPTDEDFFPARNHNRFWFRMNAPRYGLSFISDQPLENEAVISEIPPMGTVYELTRKPARFHVEPTREAGLLKSAVEFVAKDLEIEDCKVKLMELEGLDASIILIEQDDVSAVFEITVENKSTEENITASWMLWPRPEEAAEETSGTMQLGRIPVTFRIKTARDIFFQETWLAVAISDPFETDGAVAAVFPTL